MKRGVTVTARCTEPGCSESGFYEYASQKEMRASTSHHAPWYCVRHSMKDRVLSLDRLRVEWISEPSREVRGHRYWGNYGVLIGEGYYSAAKDFPVGSIVKITTEVILP